MTVSLRWTFTVPGFRCAPIRPSRSGHKPDGEVIYPPQVHKRVRALSERPSVLVFCPVHPEKKLASGNSSRPRWLDLPGFDLWVTRR